MREDANIFNSPQSEHTQNNGLQKRPFNVSNGVPPNEALRIYSDILTTHEKKEILQYKEVYYVGRASEKHPLPNTSGDRNSTGQNKLNHLFTSSQTYRSQAAQSSVAQSFASPGGLEHRKSNSELVPVFDDADNFYRVIKHDHIAYRFEVLSVLGKGSFGQVVLAMDHMKGKQVALKIIRTESRFTRQAREEIRILEELRKLRGTCSTDPDGLDFPIIQMYENFTFRKHICMTFELLSINLYDLLKLNKFAGLPRDRVRRISFQVLQALYFIGKAGIIHCDLKPENVLLIWPPEKDSTHGLNGLTLSDKPTNQSNSNDPISHFDQKQDFVKLIDFGSSCFRKDPTHLYIQSRFYRAPEVILRLECSQPIDIWSFGCLVAELINGLPLFPGEDEADQLACIMEILGQPPNELIQESPHIERYFIEYRSEKQNSSDILNFVNRMNNGTRQDVTYLPRYCSIRYPEDGGSPELSPGISKRTRTVRGVPGSMPLLKAILEQRHRRFRRKDPQSMANLTSHSQFCKSPEEEAALMKDNELLLGFMLSCLTWSSSDRIKPSKAIQNMWLRNFSKKPTGITHNSSSHNFSETMPNPRIRSMEVSHLISLKPTDIPNGGSDSRSQNTAPKELPISAPRRRKRLGNFFQEQLPFRPTINLDTDKNAPSNSGTTSTINDVKELTANEQTSSKSRSPLRFSKLLSPGGYSSSVISSGMTINAISISPSKPTNTSEPAEVYANDSHSAISNKRVTLIYPQEPSDYDNRSEDKPYSNTQSNENLAVQTVQARPIIRSRGSIPLNTVGITHGFGHNDAISMPSRNLQKPEASPSASQTARNSQVFFHSTAVTRPFSEYYTKAGVQSSNEDEYSQDPPAKLSGSVPYLNSTSNAEKPAPNRSTYRQAPPHNADYNQSGYSSNQVLIKKLTEQSPQTPVTTVPSRLIHLVRPTNGNKPNSSSSNTHHQTTANEPRLIRISNSRQANRIQNSEDTEADNGPNNLWDSQKSPNSFKSFARLDQFAPDPAPKPVLRDVILLNSGPSTNRSDSMTNLNAYTTSVWAPQPYYQQARSNNVVYRRVSGSYQRVPTIELHPPSHFTEY